MNATYNAKQQIFNICTSQFYILQIAPDARCYVSVVFFASDVQMHIHFVVRFMTRRNFYQ